MTLESREKDATIKCPSCESRQSVRFPPLRAADEFCDVCGYPLFWAVQAEMEAQGQESSSGLAGSALRRPGASGFESLGAEPCPACHELNPQSAVFCQRCGSAMHPEPEPVPEPEPEPVAAMVPVPVPIWQLVAFGALGVVLVVVLAVLLAPLGFLDVLITLLAAGLVGAGVYFLYRAYLARTEIVVMHPDEAEAQGYAIDEDYEIYAEEELVEGEYLEDEYGQPIAQAPGVTAAAVPPTTAASAAAPPAAAGAAAPPPAKAKAPKAASSAKDKAASLRGKKHKAQAMAMKGRSVRGRVRGAPSRIKGKLGFFQRLRRFF